MRKKISDTFAKNTKYLFLIFAILFFIAFITELINEVEIPISRILVHIIFIAFFMLFYFIFRHTKGRQLEFDAKYLYIIENGIERTVQLSAIIKLEKPLLQIGNTTRKWTITFLNSEGKEEKLTFNTSFFQDNFREFKQLLS